MSGNVTLISTDPQEVVDRVLQQSVTKEPTFGEVADKSAETATESQTVSVESTDHEDEHEEPGKPSKRSQKIKRLAEKLLKAEQERDEWRSKAEQPQTRREELPKESAKEDRFAYPVPKPRIEDFNGPNAFDDFQDAKTEWNLDAREYRNARVAEESANKDAQNEAFAEYNERVAEAFDKYEDFEDVVGGSKVKLWPEVQQALLVHEQGPDIVYYLAKNPETAEKLGKIRPIQAVVELGRIAASLQKEEKVSPPPKPRPRTISPVGGTTKVAVDDPGAMSFQEYKKYRMSRSR